MKIDVLTCQRMMKVSKSEDQQQNNVTTSKSIAKATRLNSTDTLTFHKFCLLTDKTAGGDSFFRSR